MTTKLRLLLDECLQAPLAEDIAKQKSLNVQWIKDTSMANCGIADTDIVNYARKNRRIVVTSEGRLNEKKFLVCTHPGIIVLKAIHRHEAVMAGMFRALVGSGVRARCRHSVTYLRRDSASTRTIAIFKERDDLGVLQETVFDLEHRNVIEATRENFKKLDCKY